MLFVMFNNNNNTSNNNINSDLYSTFQETQGHFLKKKRKEKKLQGLDQKLRFE